MENKYYANVILCEKVEDNFASVIHPFDNLETEEKATVTFEILLNLNYTIDVDTTVTFLMGVHYEGEYRPISTMTRNFGKGTGCEYSKYPVKDFNPRGEGRYIFEIRYGENLDIDTKTLDENNIKDIIEKTKVLNRYIFHVDFRKTD